MTEFQTFIKENNIKKKDIAVYLGVSNAFITQLANGSRTTPPEKLALIKARSDWDTSMLSSTPIVQNNTHGDNIHGHKVTVDKSDTSKLLDALAKSQEQIDRLITLLEKK